MLKKFLSGLGLILSLNLVIKPVWIFGIDRTVQNITGSDYGYYWTILNFSMLFSILLDLGITNFNNRRIAQNHDLLTTHFAAMVSVKLVLAIAYMLVVVLVGRLIGYDSRRQHLLLLLGIMQFLSSLILFLRSNISALLLFKTESIFSVMDKFLMILICSYLIWGRGQAASFQIEWFVDAQLVAYVLTAISAFVVIFSHSSGYRFNLIPRFNRSFLREGMPFALLVLLMMAYSRIDSVMLERLLPDGVTQVAIYANAYRLLDAANNVPYLFSVLLLPLFSRMIAEKVDVSQIVKVSFVLLFPLSVVVAAISLFFSQPLMKLLYLHHVSQSAEVFSVLMFSFVANTFLFIFGTLLTANGSLRIQNILMAISLTINVCLNLLLIPTFKVMGAAWAGVLTQGFVALAEMVLVFRLVPVRLGQRFLPAMALFVLIVFFFSWLLSRFESIHWTISAGLIGVTGLALLIPLRLIEMKSLRSLISA